MCEGAPRAPPTSRCAPPPPSASVTLPTVVMLPTVVKSRVVVFVKLVKINSNFWLLKRVFTYRACVEPDVKGRAAAAAAAGNQALLKGSTAAAEEILNLRL